MKNSEHSWHPFVVETDFLTTTVLGTSFNVRAYSQGDASVALVEGRVSVKSGRESLQLQPGQQVVVANGKLIAEHVNTYGYTQRKDGFFYFTDGTMREIMVETSWCDIVGGYVEGHSAPQTP